MGSNSAFFNEIPFGCNNFGVSVPSKRLEWRQKIAMVGSSSSNHQSIRTKKMETAEIRRRIRLRPVFDQRKVSEQKLSLQYFFSLFFAESGRKTEQS